MQELNIVAGEWHRLRVVRVGWDREPLDFKIDSSSDDDDSNNRCMLNSFLFIIFIRFASVVLPLVLN